ncbi:MAG: M20/M25/M40 family metallo-hydrolase [Clostridia bacterium]|nr:M20/M25/M40 family metallo-hydrolase [Clostridia bacterium]
MGLIILLAAAAFVAVLLIRGLLFTPKAEPAANATPETVDREKAVSDLQQLIRAKTVSYRDKTLEDEAEFEKLEQLLPQLFPNVARACEFVKPGPRSLLFCWKGQSSDKPGVLMAHYDVVPVDEEGWDKPAFDAIIEDDVMWGRGTLDTKGTLLGVLEAADSLIAEGFVPAQDLYLAFAGDEEISGDGAPCIIRWLQAHDIQPDFVLDEGGAVVENVFPGVHVPSAMVGIGEKGPMDVKLVLDSAGGHASTPPPHSPVGVLAQAVTRIESHPFPFQLTAPAAQMFDTLGRRSTFLFRVIFANLWCFKPVLNLICKKSGGELNALVRTTVAFTQMQGAAASNVLPPHAWVGANLRLIGDETTESAKAYLEKVIANDKIRVEIVHGMNPSPISRTDCEPWERLSAAIRATWTDTVVSPYLMLACSDSRHYSRICPHVYRFSAMALSKAERGMIHANNERVPLDTIEKTVAFYRRLIKMC